MSRYRNIHCLIWNDDKFQELWLNRWECPEIIPFEFPINPDGCNHYYSECDCIFTPDVLKRFHRQRQIFKVRKEFNNIRKKMRSLVFERFDNKCVYCGCSEKQNLTVDHVLPIVYGGTNDICNLVAACRSCNSKKGLNLPEEPNV